MFSAHVQKPHTHSDITVTAQDLSNRVYLTDALLTRRPAQIQSAAGRGVARIQHREKGLAVLRLLWLQPLPFSLVFYLCKCVSLQPSLLLCV